MHETNIFISYRREDSAGHAGRIYDKLVQEFGEAQVFYDWNAVPGATDFRKEIRDALRRANVVLAIIGPHWLSAHDEKGNQRLFNDKDLVRREIRTALDGGATVIPTLVGDAKLPREQDLPFDLAGICERNAIIISERSFRSDCDSLIEEIRLISGEEVLPTVESIIKPGWWAITKSNYGMAPITVNLELKRDGTIQGQIGSLGPLGQIMGALDTDGMGSRLLGMVQYSGNWAFDISSNILTINLAGHAGMFGGGSVETWRMQITGEARGVYKAVGNKMDQYTLKRVG